MLSKVLLQVGVVACLQPVHDDGTIQVMGFGSNAENAPMALSHVHDIGTVKTGAVAAVQMEDAKVHFNLC